MMHPLKPKRTVLLYCVDEDERSVLKLLLQINGMIVIGGISPECPLPDISLVVDDRSIATVETAKAIAEKHAGVPLLVIPASGYRYIACGYTHDMEVVPGDWNPAWLLQRLRFHLTRKRGPKKGFRKLQLVTASA